MTEILRPDFCVIGGGPGGLAAARAAASLGAEVVLVEKRPLGTLEPLRGAFQGELLAAAANTFGQRSPRLGLLEGEARLDFKRLCREAETVIGRFCARTRRALGRAQGQGHSVCRKLYEPNAL